MNIGVKFEVSFDSGAIAGKLKAGKKLSLELLAETLVEGFGMWIETWDHHPAIQSKIEESSALVWINDDIASVVNFGTDERFMVPTGLYTLKTIPFVLQSVPGGGAEWEETSTPRPGIVPRQADETNAERARELAPGIVAAAYAASLW